MMAAADESDAWLAADLDRGDPPWGLELQKDGAWKAAPLPALARNEIIGLTNDLDALGAGRFMHLLALRSWCAPPLQLSLHSPLPRQACMHACSCAKVKLYCRVISNGTACRRRPGFKVDVDEVARILNISADMHPLVQAATGSDYFRGVMTPLRALAAIDATDLLRMPPAQRPSLAEVRCSMHGTRIACQYPRLLAVIVLCMSMSSAARDPL